MLESLSMILLAIVLHGGHGDFNATPHPPAPLTSADADFLDLKEEYTFSGTHPLYFGPQLVVDNIDYLLPSQLQVTEGVWICAMTMGDNDVALFKINPAASQEITMLDVVSYTDNSLYYDYKAFDPSIMELPIDGTDQWCLVVPIAERFVASGGTAQGGDIMIVPLETRNSSGELVPIENGLVIDGHTPQEVYYCIKNPDNSDYLVSVCTTDATGYDRMCRASFDSVDNRFESRFTSVLPSAYFAHNNNTAGARPYENFYFDTERDLAYLTNHNCGITIWDYSTFPDTLQIESRIASQQGGWNGGIGYSEELGDVHRGAVLECGKGQNNDSRLLFHSNHTMGIMVYDITNPGNPRFVFQWDADTPPHSWDSWRGAGKYLSGPPSGTFPAAVTFGIDVCGVDDANHYIHLYCGDGCDGIRTIDFSQFLCPWVTPANGWEFTDLADTTYSFDETPGDYWAYDLRTFQEGSSLYVLTSWREEPNAGTSYGMTETGVLGLSLHRDDTITLPIVLSHKCFCCSALEQSEQLEVTARSFPNPSRGYQYLEITSNRSSYCNIEAFDLAGRTVVSERVNLVAGSNSFNWTEMSENSLPSGNYLLKVTSSTGEEIVNRSVIIN